MKHQQDNLVHETSPKDTRRKFLVKGAATALVATLPVKTGWARNNTGSGCMVSGTLSGNQSAICDTNGVSGKSPDDWDDECHSRRGGHGNSSMASYASQTSWESIFVNPPQAALSRPSRRNSNSGLSASSSLEDILDRGGELERHLVAGYLNAVDGRYPLKPDVTPEMYAAMLEEEAAKDESALISALEQTYTGS